MTAMVRSRGISVDFAHGEPYDTVYHEMDRLLDDRLYGMSPSFHADAMMDLGMEGDMMGWSHHRDRGMSVDSLGVSEFALGPSRLRSDSDFGVKADLFSSLVKAEYFSDDDFLRTELDSVPEAPFMDLPEVPLSPAQDVEHGPDFTQEPPAKKARSAASDRAVSPPMDSPPVVAFHSTVVPAPSSTVPCITPTAAARPALVVSQENMPVTRSRSGVCKPKHPRPLDEPYDVPVPRPKMAPRPVKREPQEDPKLPVPVLGAAPGGVVTRAVAGLAKVGDGVRLVGAYTLEERRVRVQRFLEKRSRRVWRKKIKYDCRKKLADNRKRVKGRFVTSRSQATPAALMMVKAEPAAEEIDGALQLFGAMASPATRRPAGRRFEAFDLKYSMDNEDETEDDETDDASYSEEDGDDSPTGSSMGSHDDSHTSSHDLLQIQDILPDELEPDTLPLPAHGVNNQEGYVWDCFTEDMLAPVDGDLHL